MEKAKDFYSRNVADAIRQACAEFGISQEKLEIEVVETGSAGIFGLCRKRAHIRVMRKKGEAQAQEEPAGKKVKPKQAKPSEKAVSAESSATGEKKTAPEKKGPDKGRSKPKERIPASSAQPAEKMQPPTDDLLDTIRADLDEILKRMGLPSEVKVTFADAAIQCQVDGEHVDSITGQDGRTLDSMQYLLRKMFSQQLPDRMMIDLNAGDFRQRRVAELQRSATELAEKVKSDGKTQAIPGLNPSERRVVHVALQDDKEVRSRSVGDGLFKKVLIYKPGSKGKKSGGRRRGRQGGRSTNK